ncbi:MAG: hypothetical protein NTW86_09205 [Candidatus Sumerlaeota bacterium]|nr:hypothetical protein [Candidatus Sumerlaeota bacterium]
MQITARRFDFRNLVQSHGWVYLSPWEWSADQGVLSRPLVTGNGRSVPVSVRVAQDGVKSIVHWESNGIARLSDEDRRSIRSQIRRMLCLDIDYSPFQRACAKHPELRFVHQRRCGGMLRCPTAFEDLIKTVCTTNCDWRNTERMCDSLCQLNSGAFPTPEVLVRFSESKLAQLVPLGYRAKTVLEIARIFHENEPPLDQWAMAGDFESITSFLRGLHGVGPYSVNHMLVLLGYYGEIPVDSEVLKYISKMHFQNQRITPKEAAVPYAEYGEFRFLAYKFLRMARRKRGVVKVG